MQDRLSICIPSLKRLKDRIDGYDIVLMDEFATTTLMMISQIMLRNTAETMEILETLLKKSKIIIMLAADGTPTMAKTLLQFVNWDMPTNLYVTVNTGGIGGISGHELYMSDDLFKVCQVLKKYVQEGKSIYIPTNQRRFGKNLDEFCRGCLGLSEDEVMFYHKDSHEKLTEEIIDEPERRLGYTPDSPYAKVRVFITTPAFGVGFSVKGDLFDITIAFFFTQPLTVPGNVQHIARIRGVKEKTIVCYYQSRLSEQTTFSYKIGDEQAHIENAVKSYETLIQSVNHDDVPHVFTEGQLQSYAINWETSIRLFSWHADDVFVDTVTKSTRTTSYLLESWECNKGDGPIEMLPELNDDETELIRNKGGIVIADEDSLPKTWTLMCELWIQQFNEGDLSEEEVEYVTIFKELPVPYGLLEEHERRTSFTNKLDCIWRVMEVASAGIGSRLLEIDLAKHNKSQGVSIVPRENRVFQQYQMFDIWARLVLSCIPEIYHHQAAALHDHGTKLLLHITSMWRWNNQRDDFHFDMVPGLVGLAVNELSDVLKDLCEKDAAINDWLSLDELVVLTSGVDKQVKKTYTAIILRGFRHLFGKNNVSVRTQKNKMVRVKIKGLKRLIQLACIRRVNMECGTVIQLCRNKFSAVSRFRSCPLLVGLIPSDEELAQVCGMDL